MVQVADYEEFLDLKRRVDQLEEENVFLKSLIMGSRWLRRKQAMAALQCSDNTLRRLTVMGRLTYRQEGAHPYYDAFSLREYLLSQKIDAKLVDQRILSASCRG